MATPRKEVTKSRVIVSEIRVGMFQKEDTETAVLKQEVTTRSFYPKAVHSSDMQQNPFSASEFGETEQEFRATETRVAFVDVPAGSTPEKVQAKIPANASLYRVLSNAPILTDNHKNAISRGLTTIEKMAESQIVRYPEGSPNAGQVIRDPQGKIQYRKVFYWNGNKEDIDNRGKVEEYVPEFLSEEHEEITETSQQPVLENQEGSAL